MIKLLALDLDGTLLDSSGKIPVENKKAIAEAEANGVLVTICTGRRFRDAIPVALELNLNAPVICHNGTLIKFADTLETVEFSLLPTDTVYEIIRVGKDLGGNALVSCNPNTKGTLLYDTISKENIPLQKYIEWSKRLHGDEAEEAIHHVEKLEEVVENEDVIHISFSGSCEPMAELAKVLKDELLDNVHILATTYPQLDFTLLDILPQNTSKGSGLAKLAELNNLTAENVMAVGDNFNDVEMLDFAGTGVVMGNALPDLLQNQNYQTTLSNDESGVAEAIKRFILR